MSTATINRTDSGETETERIERLRKEMATLKVERIRKEMTDAEMAATLGICKVTMYKRLRTKKWKITELALIEAL